MESAQEKNGAVQAMGSGLYCMVYASVPKDLFVSDDELKRILEVSRRNNARLQISGMLLYKEGLFFQVLEGDESPVRQLFTLISMDRRHHSIVMVDEGPIAARSFSDWSMGFRNLDDPAIRQVPGYSQFMNQVADPEEWARNRSSSWDLLRLFRDQM